MNHYPDSETYERLYARYLNRPVAELIDLAGSLKGKVVWDLCAGGGALSLACLRKGASLVAAIDRSYDMMKPLCEWQRKGGRWTKRLKIDCGHVSCLTGHIEPAPDVVFCRQGVNYWFDKEMVERLARRTAKGGKLIFNTFNVRPPTKPKVKEYDFEGHHFVEVSWRVPKTRMVHHVQIRDGMELHVTQFKWITSGEFFRILTPLYAIEKVAKGRTDIYVCTRR